MPDQYRPQTVSVTASDATVTIVGVDATSLIAVGDWFGILGTNIMSYRVGGSIAYTAGDTTLELTAPYAGATGSSLTGVFHREFTVDGFPILDRTDLASNEIMGEFAQLVQTNFSTIDGGSI